MKKNILIPLFVLCIAQAFGQVGWPPIGAKWHYSYAPCDIWGGCGAKEFIYFEAVKDTLVNDTLCTKIIVEHHNGKKEVKYLGDEYIFSTEDQVYNYHHGQFYMLYDFSLQVGDSVALQLGSNCNLYDQLESSGLNFAAPSPIEHFVVEKDSVEINGKKYLFIDMGFTPIEIGNPFYLFLGNRKIIKGIGSLGFLTGILTNPIESGLYGDLRCYSDSELIYTTDIPCDYLTAAEVLPYNNKVSCYPNPAGNKVFVNFTNPDHDNVQIEIWDMNGKKVSTAETCDEFISIETYKWPQGVYVFQAIGNRGLIGTGRFIKTNRENE